MYSRIYVEITNICNMNCSFCHDHSREPRMMSREEFTHILDQLETQTRYIYYHVMGEPLRHPELPAFLKMTADRGLKSVITTNGTLLAKRGREILDAGVHKVNISIHSFEGCDDEAYEKYLSMVADFADAATEADTVVVLRLWNNGCDNGQNDTALSYLRSRLDGEWADNTKGIRIRSKLHLEWGERFEWPDINAPVQGEDCFCYALRQHFGILCDGSVVPCCMDSDGVITLGNIFRQNISDILASPRAEAVLYAFERRKAPEELCRRCGYAQRFVKKD